MKKTIFGLVFLGVLLSAAMFTYRYVTNPLTPEEKAYLKKISHISSLFESAKRYSHKSKFKEAIQNYRDILILQPDQIDAKVSLANTLAWDKQYEEAEKLIQEILKEKSDHIESWIILANIYAWQNQYEKSIEILLNKLKEYPGNISILMGLANVHRWKGDKEKSQEILKEILNIDPKHAEALKFLEQDKTK